MMVRVHGLSKSFVVRRPLAQVVRQPFARTRTAAVTDVHLEVAEGEIFGLLGQNGAGKTTLFKLLSTLILPDAGTAEIAGADIVGDPARVRAALAPVIANERSLNWRLSAAENLRLFAALQGLRGAGARDEVTRVLAVTGLSDTGGKMVGLFSSGMRQRLLIARALLGRPRVLLLDEPTRSLDPISARAFRRFLRETVVRQEGCTVLLATHDAEEVWELCDRVGVLERGRMLAIDATQALRHRAGSDRHVLWLHAEDAERGCALLAPSGALRARGPAAEPDWEEIVVEIGGTAGAARLLEALASAGVRVARLERAAPSLADLIERIVRLDGGADA